MKLHLVLILSMLCIIGMGCEFYRKNAIANTPATVNSSKCAIIHENMKKDSKKFHFLKSIQKFSWSSLDGGTYHTLVEEEDASVE